MKKMETTVYQSNISIFHESLDIQTSSILNDNNTRSKGLNGSLSNRIVHKFIGIPVPAS